MVCPDCFSGVNHLLLCSSFVSAYCLSERRLRRREKPAECKFWWRGDKIMHKITGQGGVGGGGREGGNGAAGFTFTITVMMQSSLITIPPGRDVISHWFAGVTHPHIKQLLSAEIPPTPHPPLHRPGRHPPIQPSPADGKDGEAGRGSERSGVWDGEAER